MFEILLININVFKGLIINSLIVTFVVLTSTLIPIKNKYKDFLKGLYISLFIILLINNPIILENGLIYDGKEVLIAYTGFFLGPITTITSIIISVPIMILTKANNMPLINTISVLGTAFLSLGFRYLINKINNIKSKQIHFIMFIYINNIFNLLIHLIINENEAQFNDLIIPFLIIFPLLMIIFSIIHIKNINDNVYQKQLLANSINNTDCLSFVTIDLNYNFIILNDNFIKKSKIYLNYDVKKSDNYLTLMARLDIKDEVKEEIDKVIQTKKINEKIFVTNEVVIESKYFPNIEKGQVVSINITSSDITEKYYSQIKMVELSLRDDLTGFYNSKAFNKHLDSMEIESLLAVVYIDINGLKFMNDAFGHDAGDILITSVADEIKEHFVFDNSVVYRLGGDEFVIIIRNKNYDKINQLMKKLETAVNKKVLKGIPTSISVGLATAKDNDSIECLIKKAESVMYNQKIIHHKRAPFKNIESSMNIITNKDSKMKQHLENVEKLSVLLGEKIKLNAYDMTLLRSLAKYHDIGKINISDDLFNNDNRKLNKEEMVELKKQAETGYRILSRTPQFYDIAFDNLAQYENYDGTGHFRGIKGTNIPIKARIIRIVNYYDLLTHYYNQSKSDALSYLVSESGKKFDPNLVKLFVEIIENKEEL